MSDERKHRPIDETSDTGLHERFHEKGGMEGAEAAPAETAADAATEGASAPDAAPEAAAETPPPALESARRSGGGAPGVLWALALLVGGGALANWGLPKIAPNLPAPLAAYIAPAGDATEELQAEMASRLAALEGRIAETADAASRAASSAAADAVARVEALEAELAAAPQGGSQTGGADPEALATLEGRIAALSSRLDEIGAEGPAAGSEAVAALSEQVTALAARIEAAVARIDAAAAAAEQARADAAALEARFEAMGDAEAARVAALREAENARRGAAMSAALSQIDRAMTLGEPFGPALAELTEAAGEPAPEALARAAEMGAPTREALKASYSDAAYAVIGAMLEKEAEEDGGMLAGVAAKLKARVTGLPSEPIAGDSVTAVLSRARVSLLGGDLDATLAAIAALPAPAQAAMADWVEGAKLRSAADAALSSWRNHLKLTL